MALNRVIPFPRGRSRVRSATTQYVFVDGGSIAYDDTGSGPLVLCIPSLGDLRSEYRFLRRQLIHAGFRVVTMDLRGHGESHSSFTSYAVHDVAQDIAHLIQHLWAGRATLVGTSNGAASSVLVAAGEPTLVERLVLINPVVRPQPGSRAMRGMQNLLLSRPWGPAFWSMHFSSFFPTHAPADLDEYRAALETNLREPGRIEALRTMMNEPDEAMCAVDRSLESVVAPVMVVMGTESPDFDRPVDEAEWVTDRSGGLLRIVKGAGCYPHVDMPGDVSPHIVDFLTGSDCDDNSGIG